MQCYDVQSCITAEIPVGALALNSGAKVMRARHYRNDDVGAASDCSHPAPIHAQSDYGAGRTSLNRVSDEIHLCLIIGDRDNEAARSGCYRKPCLRRAASGDRFPDQ